MTNGLIIVSYKWLWYKETSEENLKPTTVDLVSLSQRSAVWKVLDNWLKVPPAISRTPVNNVNGNSVEIHVCSLQTASAEADS